MRATQVSSTKFETNPLVMFFFFLPILYFRRVGRFFCLFYASFLNTSFCKIFYRRYLLFFFFLSTMLKNLVKSRCNNFIDFNERCWFKYWIALTAQEEDNGPEKKRRLLLITMLPTALIIIILAFMMYYIRDRVLKSKGKYPQL